jgi:hypothetical protein
MATGFKGIIESGLRAVGFGRRWIWPELWGLLFNVIEGKSELWGVSSMDPSRARLTPCRPRPGIRTSFPSFPRCYFRRFLS